MLLEFRGLEKASLVNDILYRSLAQQLYESRDKPGLHDKLLGTENIDKVIIIESISHWKDSAFKPRDLRWSFHGCERSFCEAPRFNSAWLQVRKIHFNVKGGRCEACEGDGIIRLEMHFLPDVYVPCEVCKGKRYNRETLEIKYKGKNISEVLEMTVEESLTFFENIPRIRRKLETLNDVGLGYLRLGQAATTLSGGEAQRVKLSSELSKRPTGMTMYLLDEPTTGLHFEDIVKLLGVLQRLTDAGNSVIVIEHNIDVIKTADWIINLRPEGGERGGLVVAEGTPEEVSMVDQSYTGQFLKQILGTKTLRSDLTGRDREERELAGHITARSGFDSSR